MTGLDVSATEPTPDKFAVLNSTRSEANPDADNWRTPKDFLDRVKEVLVEIDLDPCADPDHSVPAQFHFAEPYDGLIRPWYGCVYMNPPYSQMLDWALKLTHEIERGHVQEAIALVPARPGSRWWRTLSQNSLLCLINGRLTFVDAPAAAPFPSAVFYFGANPEHFAYWFRSIGELWQQVPDDG